MKLLVEQGTEEVHIGDSIIIRTIFFLGEMNSKEIHEAVLRMRRRWIFSEPVVA